MEYRSRLKRRKKKETGAGRAIVAIIIIAGLVYLAASSKAGAWVAENVTAPLFEAFTREPESDADISAASAADTEEAMAVSLTNATLSSETVTVTLPSVNCYALQMGVYGVEANALAQASTLRAAGAGGYILTEEGRSRVLAAGYPDAARADEVKDRLALDGMEAAVYHIATPQASFRVTVSSEEAALVAKAFLALSEAQKRLTDTAMLFDGADATVDTAKVELADIAAVLSADTAILEEYADRSEALRRIVDCRTAVIEAIGELMAENTQSIVDFSADLKYTQLYTTHEYVKLMDSFA